MNDNHNKKYNEYYSEFHWEVQPTPRISTVAAFKF